MAYGIEITGDEKRVYVASPFNARFVKLAKDKGGRWDASRKVWSFPKPQVASVRELCKFVYGTDGFAPPDLCTIRVKLGGAGLDQEVDEFVLGGRTLVRRTGRDVAVILGADVVLVAGRGFPGSGGSVKNPRIGDNNVERELLVYGMSRPMAECLHAIHGAVVTIELDAPVQALPRSPSTEGVRRETLEAEAKILRERLAAIEAELRVLDTANAA